MHRIGMTPRTSLVAFVAMTLAACGGSPKKDAAPPSAADAPDASSSVAVVTDAAADDAAPAHPFAKNAGEATALIDDAVSSRASAILVCVQQVRTRRKDVHAKIAIEIGIDQEGGLLGVEPVKGQPVDRPFLDCVREALRGAPFPKSHTGVITIKKTFEDTVVYK
jgi:hypothetical protein